MFGAMLHKFRPIARSIKYGRLLRRAEADTRTCQPDSVTPPVAFILGCGRSGTTILGKLLSAHRGVHYMREPYYIWRTIVPSSDMIRFFGDAGVNPHCVMGSAFINDDEINRFNSCMQAELKRSGSSMNQLIEKTPINAMRIPMLNALSPSSPILHLVRNGVDVVRSINRLAETNTYQLGGRGTWNQWWGRNNCKWEALADDAKSMGWFEGEIDLLKTNTQKGALEWVISLNEMNSHRSELGDRLLEIRYSDLTKKPKPELQKICEHFSIESESQWLESCCQELDAERKNAGDSISLPRQLCATFNALQRQYGFEGEAIEL